MLIEPYALSERSRPPSRDRGHKCLAAAVHRRPVPGDHTPAAGRESPARAPPRPCSPRHLWTGRRRSQTRPARPPGPRHPRLRPSQSSEDSQKAPGHPRPEARTALQSPGLPTSPRGPPRLRPNTPGPFMDRHCGGCYAAVAQQAPSSTSACCAGLLTAPGTILFEGAKASSSTKSSAFTPIQPGVPQPSPTPKLSMSLPTPAAEPAWASCRTYFTRHGNGPLVTEDKVPRVPARTPQLPHRLARPLPCRRFDAVAARYALLATGGVDSLAITHVDRVPHVAAKLCTAYEGPLHDASWFSYHQNTVTDIHLRPHPAPRRLVRPSRNSSISAARSTMPPCQPRPTHSSQPLLICCKRPSASPPTGSPPSTSTLSPARPASGKIIGRSYKGTFLIMTKPRPPAVRTKS